MARVILFTYKIYMDSKTIDSDLFSKDIIVLYHGQCTDGFGSAYAAWKKFGDTASYIPCDRRYSILSPDIFTDKEIYVLDYSFSKEEMLACEDVAKKFIVIDHHASAEESIRALSSFVYDKQHSGAYLSWVYFHPTEQVPALIKYISDSDTWSHELPDWEEIEAYIYSDTGDHFTFSHFEDLHKTLESDTGYANARDIGKIFVSARNQKVKRYTDVAELITFEGYSVYAVNAPSEIKSILGHNLAEKTGTFSLVFNYENGYWKCSLRSVKDFDVSILAAKFGGGGHKNAAAFLLKTDFPLFSLVTKQ